MFLCCFRDNSEKDPTPPVAMSNLAEKKNSSPANNFLYDWSSLDEEMKKSGCEVDPAVRYSSSRNRGKYSKIQLPTYTICIPTTHKCTM